jgi:hypothetical protein
MNTETKKFGLKDGLRGNTTLVIERVDDGEVSSTITVSLSKDEIAALRKALCGEKDQMPIINRIENLEKAFDAHVKGNTTDLGVLAANIKDIQNVIPELGNNVSSCNAKYVGLTASVTRIQEWIAKIRG